MPTVKLEEVLNEVRALPLEEQRRLRDMLDEWLENIPPHSPVSDDVFQLHLLRLGLISEIKPPVTDFTVYQYRKPVEVKGKTVSQTLIEERR